LLEEGEGYLILHLPTHPDHFYDVRRIEFDDLVDLETGNRFFVCMLVEGRQVAVRTEKGETFFYYSETFVIPASAGNYQLINKGGGTAKVVQAFVKETFNI